MENFTINCQRRYEINKLKQITCYKIKIQTPEEIKHKNTINIKDIKIVTCPQWCGKSKKD